MELDLVPTQNRFNAAAKGGSDTTAAERYVIYEATARELEETVAAIRRQASMILDAAVRDAGTVGTRSAGR